VSIKVVYPIVLIELFLHKVPVSVIFNFVVNGEYYDLKYNLNLNHNEVVVLNFTFTGWYYILILPFDT